MKKKLWINKNWKIVLALALWCMMGIFIGTCIGSVWQKQSHGNMCEIQFGTFLNDTDIWIHYDSNTGCYDKINCNVMLDRDKTHHQLIRLTTTS